MNMPISDITLYPTKSSNGILVDARAFPIICPDCNIIFPDLFYHKSSRYGHVGSSGCSCDEQINISDNDQEFVTEIKMSTRNHVLEIDFQSFYHFTNNSFNILKRKYNYDILKHHLEEKVKLNDMLLEIEIINNIKIEPILSDTPLPLSIKKWFGLMNINEVKIPKMNKK